MMPQDLDHARYGNAGCQNDFGSRGEVPTGQVGIEEGSDRQSDDHLVICGIVCRIFCFTTTICIIICIIVCITIAICPPSPGNVVLVSSPHVGPCIIRPRRMKDVARHHPKTREDGMRQIAKANVQPSPGDERSDARPPFEEGA